MVGICSSYSGNTGFSSWHSMWLPWFIHSVGACGMRRFLAVLGSFFHSSLLCTFSCHPSPPTILPSSLTSSCHLFLGLPLNLVVPTFIYNSLLGILSSSILCTCPNQRNLFNLIVSVIACFLTIAVAALMEVFHLFLSSSKQTQGCHINMAWQLLNTSPQFTYLPSHKMCNWVGH